jgi:hypothetical protein
MSEKHTIRNSIAISVASGLILAFFLSSWVKGMLLTYLYWLWSVIKFMSGLLVHQVETPVWILVLLVTLSIFPILHVVRLLRRKGNDPSEYTYTQDNLFGVVWRWCNSSSGINHLWAFCPHCDLELVYNEQRSDYHKPSRFYPPEFTQFECENCDIKSEKLSGGKSDALGRIEREISRRLRTGEWKKNLKTEPPTEHRQR